MYKLIKGEASIPLIAVLGIATTLMVTASSFFFKTTADISSKVETVQEVNASQSASLASINATLQAYDKRQEHMDKQLDRIESVLTGVPVSKIEGK